MLHGGDAALTSNATALAMKAAKNKGDCMVRVIRV